MSSRYEDRADGPRRRGGNRSNNGRGGDAASTPRSVGALPPQNVEAEEAILGAMLMSQSAIEAAVDLGLRDSDFYRPSHRLLYNTMIRLAERGPVDELIVSGELQRLDQLEDVGGKAAIYALGQRVPAIANARTYAEEVRDQAILRGLVTTGFKISELGYEPGGEPRELVDQAGQLVNDLAQQRESSDFRRAGELVGPIYAEIAERAENGGLARGIPTGFADFDEMTGGLHAGNMVIVGGRPGMGKTSWALNVAENVALSDHRAVALFSLEMGSSELMTRVMCSLAKVDQGRIRKGKPNDDDWPLLVDAVGKITAAGDKLYIDDTSGLTPIELRTKARRLHSQLRESGGLSLIVVDYLQLMESGRRMESRQVEVSYISRQIKLLALELKVPILALSQLSREVTSRTGNRPVLSDLRESGSLEQDADIVMFVHRPEVYAQDNPELQGKAELIIAKHRNGEQGTVELGFLGKYTKFTNLARRHEAQAAQSMGYGSPPAAAGDPVVM